MAELVLIMPDGSEGQRVALEDGETVIGRGDGSVFADDPFLSPRHARFLVRGSEVVLEDLGSLNGVYVRVLTDTELTHGSEIRIGQELLRFESVESAGPIVVSKDDTAVQGSVDEGAWGRLLRMVGPGLASHAWMLTGQKSVLGRDVGDITFRDDGFVSGRHAQIAPRQGKVLLSDLGSSNGTYLRLRGSCRLGSGELVLIGQQVVRLAVAGR